ncbi:ThiF family adenylyltransferase [Algoriphagus aestuariicola]|jgi:molybdopterin/thiamine biosynthesis adenylyltransferase|uniref:ThiF family adenylyltransferase n=1 Tax=Algoriphagus aestuariicola TaxID=1852016 RepID=A0ABS3BRF0_9BACT|nr:ThiF family adenylyltransferase [Algoriphagus aestuariicola]MBN7801665.1 ThiF family adenylyltransferase [Algoriphagus aestuariicola]
MPTKYQADRSDQASPMILDPNVDRDWEKIQKLRSDNYVTKVDAIDSQVSDLIKMTHPQTKLSQEEIEQRIEEFFEGKQRDRYGNWVFYPWKNTLVHLLPEREFIQVRTSRNKYKFTEEEQALMATKKIGVVGLSVGQSVAVCLAMERSFGELRIADFDTLELSNMNRIRTSVTNLGLRKTEIVVREISEIDPYLKIKVYSDGLTKENMEAFFNDGGGLDLLIEECDSLPMKILSRLKAKSLGIPVLMDTSDRGMVDIERFDLDPRRPIFHGFLSGFGEESELIDRLEENRGQLLMAILNFEKLSERARYSIQEIGKSITTWPQLASSVVMGGAMCAYFAKRILCGQISGSGRVYVDLDEFFLIDHES